MISESDLIDPTSPDTGTEVTAFKFYTRFKKFYVLDQLRLPKEILYSEISSVQDGYDAIKSMKVRGAPCIAAVGCFSILIQLFRSAHETVNSVTSSLNEWTAYLISSRPTAVNLRNALGQMLECVKEVSQDSSCTPEIIVNTLTRLCIKATKDGQTLNENLGDHGAKEILKKNLDDSMSVLTHCNTGSLATVGYGTALGVIRSLHKLDRLERAYCTETRPYNQGSRLTAWELVQERIPSTLIADSMVAHLMQTRIINAVVVGADCVALNGDTANKIGTLQIALLAKHYGVPFYVAAPSQSVSRTIKVGREEIKIEERPASEMKCIGDINLAPQEIAVMNPCFDVTPNELITGIITEFGVFKASEVEKLLTIAESSSNLKQNQLIF